MESLFDVHGNGNCKGGNFDSVLIHFGSGILNSKPSTIQAIPFAVLSIIVIKWRVSERKFFLILVIGWEVTKILP
jgi:hypothetical protein